MKIYTKNGDQGETSILGSKRFLKNEWRITAIGEVDELNAHIGLIYSLLSLQKDTLFKTMNNLFVIGSLLASEEIGKYKLPEIYQTDIDALENAIDEMENSLSLMTHFVLPTGDTICGHIHITRAVCRRAERSLVALHKEIEISTLILPYINRLSDYLFVLARFYASQNGIEEVKWIPNK